MDILLIIVPFILIILSQAYINNAYKKYNDIDVTSKTTGHDTARNILDENHLEDVKIVSVNGTLTDNFNPSTNTISLSNDVYNGTSIASVSVAAHEACHVIQHKEKYAFIVMRSFLVPIINITSKLGYIVMIIGIIASVFDLAMIGLIFMCGALLFQIITLPTEFNASKRARNKLLELKIINNDELPLVKNMLDAAAMTYLASFFASMTQMLRLFLNLNRRN